MLRTFALAFFAVFVAAPVDASIFYVAVNGSTTTTACSRTAPCAYFYQAIEAASAGDSIVCLSQPLDGSLYITKPVSIDCSGANAVVRDGGLISPDNSGPKTVGIIITGTGTVRLRGLTIDGGRRTGAGSSQLDRGIEIQSRVDSVYIEDCVVSNVNFQGIYDKRTAGQTKLFIKNTTIENNSGAGIVSAAAATGIVVLDNVSLLNNAYGIAIAAGNNVFITRSVVSGNSRAGVEVDPRGKVTIDASTLTHNNLGVQTLGVVRLSNTNISFSNTAFDGATTSLGGNRFSSNGSIGTAPTQAGGITDVTVP